ncbi:uncharacterized protein LOC129778434 [Toxorhynchites rutilus septentrionalis]|uniref:uncharacterized protein LOC129778434 n=1 Tax=Toxorhynchites rutilus septentrionalis TaxID=329112 RepID=UPI00247B27D6|nr:uncharacterized protein LOC129778434 [Toxorhynchites rutilus septentrionalis]
MVSSSLASRQILLVLALLLCVAKLSSGRPQNAIDSQDAPEINLSELKKLYNTYVPDQLDDYGLDRLKLQLLAQYAQSNAIGGGGGWDQLYRAPEMKRQIRYRQCYFNPISCFKK